MYSRNYVETQNAEDENEESSEEWQWPTFKTRKIRSTAQKNVVAGIEVFNREFPFMVHQNELKVYEIYKPYSFSSNCIPKLLSSPGYSLDLLTKSRIFPYLHYSKWNALNGH